MNTASRRIALSLALLAGLAACTSHHPQTIVAVPEQEFRVAAKGDSGQPSPPDLIQLPLSPDDSERIVKFLVAGGDNKNLQNTGSQPNAGAEYKGLLAQLTDKSKLWKSDDLKKGGALGKWFDRLQTGGVVDSRSASPPHFPPVAAHLGNFWWVFYTHGSDVTGVIVFKEAVPQDKSRGAN